MGYTKVGYIESHGQEYIDIGVNFNSSTDKFIIEYKPTVSPNNELYGGGDYTSPEGEMYLGDGSQTGQLYVVCHQDSNEQSMQLPLDTSAFHTIRYEGGTFYHDNTVVFTLSLTIDTAYNMIAFGLNRTTPQHFGQYRISKLQIWRNGELLRDCEPAVDDDGKYCFHEKVTDVLMYSPTGTLTGPPVTRTERIGYVGINGVAKKITTGYVGVNGVAKKLIKGYVGVLTAGRGLPDGYTELEYIEFTGTQSIDTGLLNTLTSRYEVGVMPMEEVRGCIIGTSNDDNNDFRIFNTRGDLYYDYGSQRLNTSGAFPANKYFDLAFGNFYVDMNGSRIATGTTQTSFTVTDNVFIANTTQYDTTKPKQKIYYYKHYHGDTLVQDLVPAINSSGIIGFYDMVSNNFFMNAGSGTFVSGPEIGGSRSKLIFEPILTTVPVTVTNSDRLTETSNRYVIYNGTNYGGSGSFTANSGDTIVCKVKGYDDNLHKGTVTVNGQTVFSQTARSVGTYNWTVPNCNSITIDLKRVSYTSGKTTYYYGQISITTA